MNRTIAWTAPVILVLLMAGCSSQPKQVGSLEDARALVAQVNRDPMAEQVSGEELKQAQQALAKADLAIEKHEPASEVLHYAYIANRHAEIAMERIDEARAQAQIETSESERNQVLLESRAREASHAKAMAEQRSRQLEISELETEQARNRAAAARAEANVLQEELDAMKAKETERGLVMTLSGGVLFDTDESNLKPGAELILDRLADFLTDHPERNLVIEGHADAQGTDAHNVALSYDRAAAVRTALTHRVIDEPRLRVAGLGESFPVATNDTSAGRQLNRRVEIVISDEDGMFPPGVSRTASSR